MALQCSLPSLMTSYRRFGPLDLLEFNSVNLDKYTETYHPAFYIHYFTNWPEYNRVACRIDGRPVGYLISKSEGKGENWHGHVTALTVAPPYRRLGIARTLMRHLEDISESNKAAISMYERMGYSVYRRVLDYYSGFKNEDGLDLRKALSRDTHKRSVVPLPHPVHASDLDF